MRRRFSLFLVLAILSGGILPAQAATSRPVPAIITEPEVDNAPFAAILHDTEEASSLIKRAQHAVEQKDWKLVVDSLQRVIDLPGDSVLRTESGTYESARRYAHRVIASLPPDGLAAYRLINDSEARARYEKAVAEHDEATLREIVDRLFLTRYGDDAALALAGWQIDKGQSSNAAALLQDLKTVYPDPDVSRAEIDCELALALALSGQKTAARQVLLDVEDAAADPVVASRIQAVRDLVPKLQAADLAVAGATWPMAMGSTRRMGLMQLVEPAMQDRAMSSISLQAEGESPLADVEEQQRSSQMLPAIQPVSDGRVLVVKQAGRILAIDAQTFEPLWESSPPADSLREQERLRNATVVRLGQFQRPGQPDGGTLYDRTMRVQRLLMDRVESAVTISHGMVMSIRRGSESLVYLNRLAAMESSFRWAIGEGARIRDELVAYDLETGRPRWRHGPSPVGQAADPLSDVEFLAPPTPVGDALLASYRSAGDLYAAVLDPASGQLRRQIYLCGLGSGDVNSFEPLQPCVADGVAYVPTNRGVLLAIDTTTWTIRWASRYPQDLATTPAVVERFPNEQRAFATSIGWRDCPPIATSGLVLLAPADADRLYAFNRVDGRISWIVKRRDHQYALGANTRHCWLAGPHATQISLDTGREVWQKEVGVPTGRGAISGDRLYLPTRDALMVLRADNGETIDRIESLSDRTPLGNLLCCGGALYSCDLRSIRRYPDIVRSYESSLAAYRKEPSPATAIRLASLELLRDQPSQALVVLERMRAESGPIESRYAESAAHLQTEALLALARQPQTSDARASEYLRAARESASSPADMVRTGLALAERMQREGKIEQAYRQYVEIVLAEPVSSTKPNVPSQAPGDVMLDAAPGVQQPARCVVASRLAALQGYLDAPLREALSQELIRRLEEALGSNREAGLRLAGRMADAGLSDEVAMRSRLRLAAWAQADERFEEAEYHLRRVVQSRASATVVSEALARLAVIYLGPDELHMPLSAVPLIRRLGGEYAKESVPAELLDESKKGTVTGAEAAVLLQQRIRHDVLAYHQAAVEGVRLGPPGEVVTIASRPDSLPLTLRQGRPEPLAETMLLLSDQWEVRAHRVKDGQLLWPAMLRLADEPVQILEVNSSVAPRVVVRFAADGHALPGIPTMPRPQAVYDGQALILNTDRGLHAVGMATGLRLWSRRFRPAAGSITASDAFIWTENGSLLSVDADGMIRMAETVNGDRILWRRSTGGERWLAARIRGDYVVAVDDAITRATMYRKDDGRLLGHATFPVNAKKKLSLTMFDEVLCGPVGDSEIAAFELATPGVERWRIRCEQQGRPLTVTGLFKPRGNLLGIGCGGGVARLVDPSSGRVILEIQTGYADLNIIEGAITDGVCCLYGTRSMTEGGLFVLAADAKSGQLLWSREAKAGEFWSRVGVDLPSDNSLLTASANAIPVARLVSTQPGNSEEVQVPLAAPGRFSLELTILDKRTGKPIGETRTVKLSGSESMTMIDHVLAWPDRVVVVGGTTYVTFPMPWPDGGGER